MTGEKCGAKIHYKYSVGSDGYGISDRTPQAKSKYDYRHGGAATQYSTAEKKLETHHLNYGMLIDLNSTLIQVHM